jgi:hypothetical protein
MGLGDEATSFDRMVHEVRDERIFDELSDILRPLRMECRE